MKAEEIRGLIDKTKRRLDKLKNRNGIVRMVTLVNLSMAEVSLKNGNLDRAESKATRAYLEVEKHIHATDNENLIPLAVTGHKQRQHPKKLKERNEPERARIRERAKALWRENPTWTINKVSEIIRAEGSTLGKTNISETIKPLRPK